LLNSILHNIWQECVITHLLSQCGFKVSYIDTLKALVYLEKIPYILESNLHRFYSFRGLTNQMRITVVCRLDLRSRAGFWKNNRAAVHAVRTTQYNNLLFYLLLIII